MKENLLVTLADEKTIDRAKQLFSSVYWKGGWEGNLMLLAYKIPERKLSWFKDKGILIKKLYAPPIAIKKEKYGSRFPPVVLAKLYVFMQEFKKWKHVVFLDTDIIVKANINQLASGQGFRAVTDILPLMESQVDDYAKTTAHPVMLKTRAFNSGVFSFSTDIIAENTFHEICALASEYLERTMYYPDQAILNAFFAKKWKKLPFFYNLYYLTLPTRYRNNPSKIKCAILHFAGEYKPWHLQSPCYQEWAKNLSLAEAINLNNPQKSPAYSFSVFDPLYYRYLYEAEVKYFYHKFLAKLIKQIAALFGRFNKDIVLGRGWYTLEYHDTEKKHFIWNTHQSEIFINPNKVAGIEFDVMLSPLNKKEILLEVYDGNSLVLKRNYRTKNQTVHMTIPVKATKIRFFNDIFIPANKENNSIDIRKLGIMLLSPLTIHKKGAKIVSLPLDKVLSYKDFFKDIHAKLKK